MDLEQVMAALQAAGNEQYRRIYLRHGMREPLFGVSHAALGRLRKAIGKDQELADSLWITRNGDARVLAAMIAEPAKAPLQRWVLDLDCYPITDAFAKWAAAPAPGAFERALGWIDADGEWIESAGWTVLALLAAAKGGGSDDERWAPFLERIARDISRARNRVRYSMNGLLIAIGLRSEGLREQALAIAAAIGPVEVDHGETGCETPDAVAMIRKGWERKRAKTPGPKSRTVRSAVAAKTARRTRKAK